MQTFLLEREAPARQTPATGSDSLDIKFVDASFGVEGKTLLHNITTTINHGKRTFVVGRVGSGKSKFLEACLGEVDLGAGEAVLPSIRTGFCSQDAWLRTESIRSSILFLSDFDEDFYNEVLRAVALDVDLRVGLKPQAERQHAHYLPIGNRGRRWCGYW